MRNVITKEEAQAHALLDRVKEGQQERSSDVFRALFITGDVSAHEYFAAMAKFPAVEKIND